MVSEGLLAGPFAGKASANAGSGGGGGSFNGSLARLGDRRYVCCFERGSQRRAKKSRPARFLRQGGETPMATPGEGVVAVRVRQPSLGNRCRHQAAGRPASSQPQRQTVAVLRAELSGPRRTERTDDSQTDSQTILDQIATLRFWDSYAICGIRILRAALRRNIVSPRTAPGIRL
jgi:hypothetical protein